MKRFDLARFGMVRAGALIVITLTVLGVLAGLAVVLVQGPRWNASTSVLVKVSSVESLVLSGNAYPVTIADEIDASSLATSQTVLEEAVRQLHTPGGLVALQKEVTAAPQGSSHAIVVQATDPDPQTAQRIADVVAAVFVDVQQKRMNALVASLPPANPADSAGSAILRRAQLVAQTLQPLQIFHTVAPLKLSAVQAPLALGFVGLAAGVLVVLAMVFLGRRIDRARDAQRLLSLPAVDYGEGTSSGSKRLVRGMLNGRGVGHLLVCPVDADAESAALGFADWAREQDADASADRVRLLPEPVSTVTGARPEPEETTGMLLVVPRGSSRQLVADSAALLATWRPVDAVVVTR